MKHAFFVFYTLIKQGFLTTLERTQGPIYVIVANNKLELETGRLLQEISWKFADRRVRWMNPFCGQSFWFSFLLFLCGCSPKTFDVNTAQLTEKYKELQWKLHPDKFSDVSEVCAYCVKLGDLFVSPMHNLWVWLDAMNTLMATNTFKSQK